MREQRYDLLTLILMAVSILLLTISVVTLAFGGVNGALTGPVAIQALLVVVALWGRRRRPSAAPVDGLLVVIALELVRGVAVPVLIQVFGQEAQPPRDLGSAEDGARILLIANVFFALFVLVSLALRLRGPRAVEGSVERTAPAIVAVGAFVAIGLGLIGLALRFPSLGAIQDFLLLSGVGRDPLGGVAGLLASTLRPLLPLGLAVLLLQYRSRGARVVVPLVLALALTSYLALGSYNLNRSAFLFPIAAFALVCIGYAGIRVRWRVAALVLGGAAAAFLAVGVVRQAVKGAAPALANSGDGGPIMTAVQTLIIYGQSPLQSAPVLTPRPEYEWSLTTLWYSFLSPIPGVPDWVRDASGASQYNAVLYSGASTPRDQILPSWLEAYLSAGWLGPIILGAVPALVIHLLDVRTARAANPLTAYALAITIIWTSQLTIGSFAAVGQCLLFFCAPPLVLALGVAVAGRQRARAAAVPS